MEFIILGVSWRHNRTSIDTSLILGNMMLLWAVITSFIFPYLQLHVQDKRRDTYNKEKKRLN